MPVLAFAALLLGLFLGFAVADAVGGGFVGLVLGVLTFIAVGWVIYFVPPAIYLFLHRRRATEKAIQGADLVADDETYLGGVQVVYFTPDGDRSMGFFGVGEDAWFIVDASVTGVRGVQRIEAKRTGLLSRPSRFQAGAWDMVLTRAVDLDAYDAALEAGDEDALNEASEVITLFVAQDADRRKLNRLERAARDG